MCVNVMTVVLHEVNVVPVMITPFNMTETGEDFNATEIRSSLDLTDRDFYSIGTALNLFFNKHVPLIESFPGQISAMCTHLGGGQFFADALTLIWRFIWVGWIISVLMGRDFMP